MLSSALAGGLGVFGESVVLGNELFIGQVGEEVHFKIVGFETSIILGVVSSDELKVFEPDLESVVVFDGIVVFVVFFFPNFKHDVFVWLHVGVKIEEADGGNSD